MADYIIGLYFQLQQSAVGRCNEILQFRIFAKVYLQQFVVARAIDFTDCAMGRYGYGIVIIGRLVGSIVDDGFPSNLVHMHVGL